MGQMESLFSHWEGTTCTARTVLGRLLSFSLWVRSVPKPVEQKLASTNRVKEPWGQNHEIVNKVSRPEKSLLENNEVIQLGICVALYVGVGGKESLHLGQEPDSTCLPTQVQSSKVKLLRLLWGPSCLFTHDVVYTLFLIEKQ